MRARPCGSCGQGEKLRNSPPQACPPRCGDSPGSSPGGRPTVCLAGEIASTRSVLISPRVGYHPARHSARDREILPGCLFRPRRSRQIGRSICHQSALTGERVRGPLNTAASGGLTLNGASEKNHQAGARPADSRERSPGRVNR